MWTREISLSTIPAHNSKVHPREAGPNFGTSALDNEELDSLSEESDVSILRDVPKAP